METVYELLDKDKFIDFLKNRPKPYDGILQKFIEPKGEHNNMIKVIWSPSMCLFERRQNKNSIFDKKLNMYERVLTYEG